MEPERSNRPPQDAGAPELPDEIRSRNRDHRSPQVRPVDHVNGDLLEIDRRRRRDPDVDGRRKRAVDDTQRAQRSAGLMDTTTGAAVETPAVAIASGERSPHEECSVEEKAPVLSRDRELSQSQPPSASVSNMTPPPSIGAFRLYRAILHLPQVNLADAL